MRYVVILAGGVGTRLWPMSRRGRPKQFTAVVPGGRSLLQQTYDRIRRGFPMESVYVSTGESYVEEVHTQLPELPTTQCLVEPIRRDTAAAIAYAAHRLHQRDPEAVFSTVASDAYVTDPDSYLSTLAFAQDTAETADVDATLVGLQPMYPETGYGYIEVASPIDAQTPRVISAVRFVEKPDAVTAQRYVADGRFLWNPALFTFRARRFLAALARHLPMHAEALSVLGNDDRPESVYRAFASMPSISIDYGLLERFDAILVVRGEFAWSDVGHWRAVHDVVHRDDSMNTRSVQYIAIDGSGNFAIGPNGKLIVTVGMSDVAVIDTADALLVCPLPRAHEVREVVAELDRRGLSAFL